MSNSTRHPRRQETKVDELQSQRQRLHQAWMDGASLEDTATLMHSVLRLLPDTGTKRRARLPPPVPKANVHRNKKLR